MEFPWVGARLGGLRVSQCCSAASSNAQLPQLPLNTLHIMRLYLYKSGVFTRRAKEKNTSRCLRLPLTIAMRKRVEGRLKELDEKHEAEVDTQNK